MKSSGLAKKLEEIKDAHHALRCAKEDAGLPLFGALFLYAFSVICVFLVLAAGISIMSIDPKASSVFPMVAFAAFTFSFVPAVVAYRVSSKGRQANLKEANERLERSIEASRGQFNEEFESWKGDHVFSSPDLVEKLIRTVKTKQAAKNPALVQPHRGQLILALGVLGWLFPLLSVAAWLMGNADLESMDSGKMDRSGYSQTNSGRTLGKVATILYGGIIALAFLSRM